MSVTGVWIVGALPDEALRDLPRAAVQGLSSAPLSMPEDVSGELAWWESRAKESMFRKSATSPGSWRAEEDAFRLHAFLDACRDDSEEMEALRDAVMDRFPPHGEEGLFAAVARKACPFSALAYALGPDAVRRLPGWVGDFLLDAEQVRARLPAVAATLDLTGARRRDAVERIHAWMTGLGDDPHHDADELLDGPLRVLRHAAHTGQAVAAQVRWY
ncbi:hypothetical protein ACFV06_04235 [Streptomyces sp. NPDC059618]|uniref:hypothetical protein n=1 Tax=Streptomyces sp. NPDC059618 TaxID=3346887 RepID=UPI0036A11B2D